MRWTLPFVLLALAGCVDPPVETQAAPASAPEGNVSLVVSTGFDACASVCFYALGGSGRVHVEGPVGEMRNVTVRATWESTDPQLARVALSFVAFNEDPVRLEGASPLEGEVALVAGKAHSVSADAAGGARATAPTEVRVELSGPVREP